MMTKGCVGSDHGWVSQCNHPRRCSATIWRTIAAYHHCSHLSFDAIITFINFEIFLILIEATIYPFPMNCVPKYNMFVIVLVMMR